MHEQDLRTLWVLNRVEALGSFAAAGRELGLTRAAVSRLIAQSERRLGVRLAHRSTRQVLLTERARSLVAASQAALATLGAAVAALGEDEGALRGPLRIGCSHALGRHVLMPALWPFLREHPGVRLDLQLSDGLEDLLAQRLDFTVRLGPLPDSSLVARPVGHVALLLVASPEVVSRFPPPQEPADLRAWPAIALKPPSTLVRRPWRFATPSGEVVMPLDEPAAEVNSPDAGLDMARAGLGLAMLPRYLVRDDVATGRLQAVLPQCMVQGPAVHVCTTQRDLLPERVSRLLQVLVPALRAALAEA